MTSLAATSKPIALKTAVELPEREEIDVYEGRLMMIKQSSYIIDNAATL